MRFLVLFLALILLPTSAFSGGSHERVHVQRLSLLSDVSYILVVLPVSGKIGYDRRMGSCKKFEVHGTLQRLKSSGRSSGTPTKEEHLAALAYLKKLEGSPKTLLFGWIGKGFKVINPKNPCIVKSRGLRHYRSTVLSFFYAV